MFDYRVYDYSLIWSAEAYSWTFSFFLASAALNLFDYEKYNPQMKMKKTSSFVLQVSSLLQLRKLGFSLHNSDLKLRSNICPS